MWFSACAFLLVFLSGACHSEGQETAPPLPAQGTQAIKAVEMAPGPRVIHVFVALCDNEHQGIVPVPSKMGNGRDPVNNLYWGAAYGVKTFFQRDKQWKHYRSVETPREHVLERTLFHHVSGGVVLVADAYDGAYIRNTIEDLLAAAAGRYRDSVEVAGHWLGAGGAADLVAYVGHNGLMDFSVKKPVPVADSNTKDLILLACYSKAYFAEMILGTNSRPLIWTTHLMAPEAYTLAASIDGWIAGEDPEVIHQRAAAAYHQYQHCGKAAAARLIVTGW
jgi:hypothetical protein